MCGHVGIIAKSYTGLIQSEFSAFEDMLYIDALRGEDATGVCLVNKEQDVLVIKDATPPWVFMEDKEFEILKSAAIKSGKVLLGHNRKKTIGSNKPENAHPFLVNDDKVFFHNGTLYNHKDLGDTEVDSEALGQHLTNLDGNASAIQDALSKVQGAYACVWYDHTLNKVFFVRNKDRTLFWAKTTGGNILYASEPSIIAMAASRNDMTLNKDGIMPFKEHYLYEIDCSQYDPIMMHTELKVKPFFPVIKVQTPQYTHLGTKTNTGKTTNSTVAKLTKNAWKRIYKEATGKETFFQIDHVYKDVTEEGKFTLTGKNITEFGQDITIRTTYKSSLDIIALTAHLVGRMCRGVITYGFYLKEYECGHLVITTPKFSYQTTALLSENETKTCLH